MESVWGECYDVLSEDGTMWVVVDTVTENGDLTLLPYHISQRAENVGFILQDLVTWYKPTAIAGMTDRNVVNKKEYIVYLSKQEDHYCDISKANNGADDPAMSPNYRLGNLWRYPVKRGTIGEDVLHKAPYPKSLIDRIVKISTSPGDTILDPFLGSGTTATSALSLDRECIGYEINQEFSEVVEARLSQLHQRSLDEF
jgi:site-specific DNA-methyltransferase (adenine-specific)